MKPQLTAERACVLVREVAANEGPYAQEVAALSICVGVIEPLPQWTRKRIVKHLASMFDGADSLDLLTALVAEINELRAARRSVSEGARDE